MPFEFSFGARAKGASVLGWVLLAVLSAASHAEVSEPMPADADLKAREIQYREKLAEYKKARAAYEEIAVLYWKSIGEKRTQRLRKLADNQRVTLSDYVVEQPPAYTGPPEPQNLKTSSISPEPVPVVADFLKHAKEQFSFVPETPANENDYKHAYAKAASDAGLTPEQCVNIYAFEAGGNGTYDVQAGLEYDTPSARAITTALGYNQLLGTNSVEMLAEAGDEFLATLRARAERLRGPRHAALQQKILVLKKMIAFSRSVPDRWHEHTKLAGTSKGLGIHALNLDVDVGPLLQVRKLLTSVEFAKRRGYTKPLTAAELEMMNLTGDGNGFDMVVMPDGRRRKIPTSNFFQRGGYERNPVAIANNTVAKLLAATNAKMASEAQLQGAKELAASFKVSE
jgi:hypothetical protein